MITTDQVNRLTRDRSTSSLLLLARHLRRLGRARDADLVLGVALCAGPLMARVAPVGGSVCVRRGPAYRVHRSTVTRATVSPVILRTSTEGYLSWVSWMDAAWCQVDPACFVVSHAEDSVGVQISGEMRGTPCRRSKRRGVLMTAPHLTHSTLARGSHGAVRRTGGTAMLAGSRQIDERRLPPADLARLLDRRGDVEGLRRLAWQMIEDGAEAVVEVDGERLPVIRRQQADLLCSPRPAHKARLLVAPARVPLLWSDRIGRLFACDCAERVLPLFERRHPGDDRPRRAIEAARRYAQTEVDAPRAPSRLRVSALRGVGCDATAASEGCADKVSEEAALAASWTTHKIAAGYCYLSAPHFVSRRALWVADLAGAGEAEEAAWQSRRLLAYLLGIDEVTSAPVTPVEVPSC